MEMIQLKGLEMRPLVLEKGVQGRNYQQNRNIFGVSFFQTSLSQGKKLTWILKKMRIYVGHRSFDVCRDVLKYE